MKRLEYYLQSRVGFNISPSLLREDRVLKILEIVARNKGAKKFLDIGCGDGSLTMLIKEVLKAEEVYGIELSTEGVIVSKEKGIRCIQLDIDGANLPYPDDFFDFVFGGEVIEHLFNPDHLLEEIYRVLKRGGSAVFTLPNLASFWNRILLLLGYQPLYTSASLKYPEVGKFLGITFAASGENHIRVPTFKAFKKLLELHSFKIKTLWGAHADTSQLSKPLYQGVMSISERIVTKFPSLATRIIAEVEK